MATSFEIGTSRLSPSVGAGYLNMQQQDTSLRLGQGSDQLLGGVTGIQLGLRRRDGSGYGSGIYVLSSGLQSRLTAGIDGELPLAHVGIAGALLGAEGSWRLFTSTNPGKLSFYGHFGRLSRNSGPDWGLSSSIRPTGWLLASASSSSSGSYTGGQGQLSMAWKSRMFTFEHFSFRDRSSQSWMSAANLFLPIRTDLAALRYQLLNSTGDTRTAESEWSGTYYHSTPQQVILNATGQYQPGRGVGWQLGGAASFLGRSRIELDVGARPGRRVGLQQAILQLPIGDFTRVGILYGPSRGFRSAGRTGLGFEISRVLDLSPNSRGSVEGQVEASGGPLPSGLRVVLDGYMSALVDSTGHFRYPKVEAGAHQIAIDLARVPSDWSGADSRATAAVLAGRTCKVYLTIQRTASIGGSIIFNGSLPAALPNAFPFRDVVIVLSNGWKTATDEYGRYEFSNLQPGSYTVELQLDSTPEGFRPIGPTKWNLQVGAGTRITDANFQVEIKPPVVIFTEPE